MTKTFTFGQLNCERFILGPLEVNTYLIYEQDSSCCILVDPAFKSQTLINRIKELHIDTIKIFLTHGHADHIEGVETIKNEFDCEILISKEDAPMLLNASLNLSTYIAEPFTTPAADTIIKDGETISTGKHKGTLYSVRGHTAGGMILVFENFIISGDTLFAESVGRSDFPGGDGRTLISDIKHKILSLEDRIVLPGHGPETSIEHEKKNNPFF